MSTASVGGVVVSIAAFQARVRFPANARMLVSQVDIVLIRGNVEKVEKARPQLPQWFFSDQTLTGLKFEVILIINNTFFSGVLSYFINESHIHFIKTTKMFMSI